MTEEQIDRVTAALVEDLRRQTGNQGEYNEKRGQMVLTAPDPGISVRQQAIAAITAMNRRAKK